MKRAWVEFRPQIGKSYPGFHRRWSDESQQEDPAATAGAVGEPVVPVPGKGYPTFFVELDDFVFESISTAEMETCASVLEQRLVTGEQSQQRWYRKLPAATKSPRYRQRAAPLMRDAATSYNERFSEIVGLPSAVLPAGATRGPLFRVELVP